MSRTVGMMTTALGAYMTFKMWAEFQDALGTVFGGAWAVIIATLTFLIYQSNKNDVAYETSMGEINGSPSLTKKAMEAENPQPLAFIAGTYLLILVIFELLLGLVWIGVGMAGLMDIFLLKERVNGERDNIFMILFEKASILLALLLITLVGVALELPGWGVAVLLGASLGPVVYGHYYFIYIRPVKKKQNLDGDGKRALDKGK